MKLRLTAFAVAMIFALCAGTATAEDETNQMPKKRGVWEIYGDTHSIQTYVYENNNKECTVTEDWAKSPGVLVLRGGDKTYASSGMLVQKIHLNIGGIPSKEYRYIERMPRRYADGEYTSIKYEEGSEVFFEQCMEAVKQLPRDMIWTIYWYYHLPVTGDE